jgi:DNA-binding LacI/PurR family transcriptional regulator
MSTIHEVAELAGVSPMTAARILAGKSPGSKSREKVLRCAQKLDYVRNQQAANLRTGRSRLIGVMVPFIDNPFYTKFLQEMHDAVQARGYQSLIACSFGQHDAMLAAINLFETYNVDAIALDVSEGVLSPEVQFRLAALEKRSRSVLVTGSQLHDIGYDHLYLDNRSAVAKVMNHLLSRGHQSVGFVGGLEENLNIRNRLEAFKEALGKARLHINPAWISLGNPSLGNVTQRVHRMLRAAQRPSAIVCSSDMIAMVVIKAAHEVGLRVPQDLAVTGFDDIDQAKLLNPSLTTLRQPLRAMAGDIIDLLLLRLEKRELPVQERRYEAELVIRESS